MKKKIGVLALAAAIAVSMANFSASAEDAPTETGVPFEVTAAFPLPVVDVTFPTSAFVLINPYHLDTANDGLAADNSGVTSPEYAITNNSDEVGITVSARLSAYASSGVSIAAVDETTGEAPVFRNDGTEQKQVFAFLNTTTVKGTYANNRYTIGDDSQLAFTETAPDKPSRLMRIEPLSSGYFKIQGDVVEYPQTNWNTSDSVTLNIIFDVNPYNPGINSENTTTSAEPIETAFNQ